MSGFGLASSERANPESRTPNPERGVRFRIVRYRSNVTTTSDVEMTRALERGEVPGEGFRHASHLRVAWVYLSEARGADEALAHMAATLRRFTASVGQPQEVCAANTCFFGE